jgi:hypothetical protein
VRQAGGGRRDYAGISSANSDEKSGRRKPKVSWGREIRPGLVGPKARPKGVADGQLVNIPVPSCVRLTEGVTQEDSPGLVMVQVQAFRLTGRQIRLSLRLRCNGEGRKAELGWFHTDEKNLVGSTRDVRTANRHR